MILTETQKQASDRGMALLAYYREISLEHADPTTNLGVIAGDMLADIQYTMSSVYDYPAGDVESVRIVALTELQNAHGQGDGHGDRLF